MIANYSLGHKESVLEHGPIRARLLHDISGDPESVAIDALVASGDCFEMLASSLDQLSRTLPEDAQQQPELEQLIRTLLYLHRHYVIRRKYPPSRQR